MAYESTLKHLNNDISLYTARQTFESSALQSDPSTKSGIAPITKSTDELQSDDAASKSAPAEAREVEVETKRQINPILIDEEINYHKQYLSKLKFIYLEQETRDRFLRLILSVPTSSISQQQLAQLTEQNKQSKQQLKSLKIGIDDTIGKIDQLSQEVIDLNEAYQQKLDEVSGLEQGIREMDQQLTQIIQDIKQDEDQAILFSIQKSNNFKVSNLDEITDVGKAHLENDTKQWHELQAEIASRFSQHQEKLSLLSGLQSKLNSLEITLQNQSRQEQERQQQQTIPQKRADDVQVTAQLVKQLSQFLTFFVHQGDKLDVVRLGANYQIFLDSGVQVLVTPSFSVLKIGDSQGNDMSQSYQHLIEDVNLAGNDTVKFLKLVNFFQILSDIATHT